MLHWDGSAGILRAPAYWSFIFATGCPPLKGTWKGNKQKLAPIFQKRTFFMNFQLDGKLSVFSYCINLFQFIFRDPHSHPYQRFSKALPWFLDKEAIGWMRLPYIWNKDSFQRGGLINNHEPIYWLTIWDNLGRKVPVCFSGYVCFPVFLPSLFPNDSHFRTLPTPML